MNLNSAFSPKGVVYCPTCRKLLPPSFAQRDAAWKCIQCPTPICVWCYSDHTTDMHPEMYALPVALAAE